MFTYNDDDTITISKKQHKQFLKHSEIVRSLPVDEKGYQHFLKQLEYFKNSTQKVNGSSNPISITDLDTLHARVSSSPSNRLIDGATYNAVFDVAYQTLIHERQLTGQDLITSQENLEKWKCYKSSKHKTVEELNILLKEQIRKHYEDNKEKNNVLLVRTTQQQEYLRRKHVWADGRVKCGTWIIERKNPSDIINFKWNLSTLGLIQPIEHIETDANEFWLFDHGVLDNRTLSHLVKKLGAKWIEVEIARVHPDKAMAD